MLKGERCIYFSCYCSNAENNHAFQNSNSNKNNKFKLNRGFLIVLARKAEQFTASFCITFTLIGQRKVRSDG